MQTPLILATSTSGPSTSADRFCPAAVGSNNSSWLSTFATAATPIADAGTISNLQICFPATGAGTYAVTLYVNGVASALTCTVDLTTGSTSSDNAHSVTVAAGDLIAWLVHPAGTPTAQTNVQISAVFTSTNAGHSPVFGATSSTNITADSFITFGAMDNNATLANINVVWPTGGTLDHLFVNLTAAPGTGNSWVFTIFQNGVSTGVTCTVADTATTASDLTHSITIAAGDTICLQAHAVGTPAGTFVRFGGRWIPTTDGEAVLLSHWDSVPSAAADRFGNVQGNQANLSTEASLVALVPMAVTFKKMFLNLGTAPGTGKTRSVWLRNASTVAGLADTTLTCGAADTGTTANDTTHTVSAAAGSFVSLRTNSTSSATSPVTMRVGMVAFTAGTDTTPDQFTFTDQTNVARSTVITGAAITVSGINSPAPVGLSGDPSGKVKINGGAATSSPGNVSNGDTVAPVVTSSNLFSTTSNLVVTIGGVSDTFSATTVASETSTFTITATDSAGVPASVSIAETITTGPASVGSSAPAGIGRTSGYNAGTTADFVVAQDGSGTHSTIAAALASAAGGSKTIRVKAGTYREQFTISAANITLARYGTDAPVVSGGLVVTGWTQCTSADQPVVGPNFASIYKVTINTSVLAHSAYNALLLTENGTTLDVVTRRHDETDLWEQTDDNAFFRHDQGDDVTIGVDANGFATTVTHPSVLGAGTWTDTQLTNAAVMLLVEPNVPAVLDVASSSGGVLTLSNPKNYKPDLSPSGGAYALMNIMPYMKTGQWGWVPNGDGTLTLYLRPNNTADLTSGITIAQHTTCITVTGANCTLDGLTATHTADTLTGSGPIVVNGASGCTIKETLVHNYSHAQKGYGGIFAKNTTNFHMFNSESYDGQNQYDFFCEGTTPLASKGTRIYNFYGHHCSQTGPRFYGQFNVAFLNFDVADCGRAAHANKINFYTGSDQILVVSGKFDRCGGYGTMQQASNLLMVNVLMPSDDSSVSGGGRAFYDQTATVEPPVDPATNYLINCAFPRSAGANTSFNAVSVGQVKWAQSWKVYNCVADGIGNAGDATKLLDTDYNILTKGAAVGAHDQTSTQATLYADPSSNDFRAKAAGNILNTSTGKDVTAIIAQWEAWFPDVNIRQAIGGVAWDPATPGVGPYGPGNWPVAA